MQKDWLKVAIFLYIYNQRQKLKDLKVRNLKVAILEIKTRELFKSASPCLVNASHAIEQLDSNNSHIANPIGEQI